MRIKIQFTGHMFIVIRDVSPSAMVWLTDVFFKCFRQQCRSAGTGFGYTANVVSVISLLSVIAFSWHLLTL